MAKVRKAAKSVSGITDDSSNSVKRVALIVEAGLAPRRRMLAGVARYMHEHTPWAIYIKPALVEKHLDKWLKDWNGDGIIAAVNEADVAAMLKQKIPVVDMVGIQEFANVPLVHANDASVGKVGAEHLMERGFRNFGFCEYPEWAFSVNRRHGFAQALSKAGYYCHVHGLPAPIAGIGGPEQWEKQQRELATWLQELPKPVAVMASSDSMGQQILEACQRLKIRVPDEVAVLGADNDEPICMLSYPPLSSVVINDHQRGYEAAALLDRMMDGEPSPKQTVLIEPAGVVSRASTDIMATDDEAVVAAMRFLRERATEQINVDDVVARVPVCRSMLERRFRRIVGRSINEEIIRLRLDCAITLLTQTELELKAIAVRAGFRSQSYMSTVFRSNLGRTPGSYRMGAKR